MLSLWYLFLTSEVLEITEDFHPQLSAYNYKLREPAKLLKFRHEYPTGFSSQTIWKELEVYD